MPDIDDPALHTLAEELRASGEIVINNLGTTPDPRCDRELAEREGHWQIATLEEAPPGAIFLSRPSRPEAPPTRSFL